MPLNGLFVYLVRWQAVDNQETLALVVILLAILDGINDIRHFPIVVARFQSIGNGNLIKGENIA